MNKKILTQDDVEKLQSMANWMDGRFSIPGTSIRFGLDSLLGLVPGVGDSVTLISTIYLLSVAHAHGLPWHIKVKMIGNAFIDWLIGIIPFFGDIFDIGWKSNLKNVELIKNHVDC